MDQNIKDKFKKAIISKDVLTVRTLLEQYAVLANVDLRPEEEQSDHSYVFALNLASEQADYEMCKLLLEKGANPDGETGEQRNEIGIPLCNAIEQEQYKLASLFLDHNANPNAYGYCSRPMFETLFMQARVRGIQREVLRYGFQSCLGEVVNLNDYRTGDNCIEILIRVLASGVIPNNSTIVREEYRGLIADLLERCPDSPSSTLSYPKGSFFEGIVYCSSWYGYPKILRLAHEKCPNHFTVEVAKWSVYRGIISHNRDGNIEDYLEMLRYLLQFLSEKQSLHVLNTKTKLNPFHLIAEHFCWPKNYGYKAKVSTANDMIRITQLFLDFGFIYHQEKHVESGLTAYEIAGKRSNQTTMEAFRGLISKIKAT